MEHEIVVLIRTDTMILRYAYHKPYQVQLNLGLVNSRECDRCTRHLKQLDTYFVTETLVTLRFRQLARHFTKPRNFEDISVSCILYFIQDAQLLDALI
jgi:hypothetical protein